MALPSPIPRADFIVQQLFLSKQLQLIESSRRQPHEDHDHEIDEVGRLLLNGENYNRAGGPDRCQYARAHEHRVALHLAGLRFLGYDSLLFAHFGHYAGRILSLIDRDSEYLAILE